MPVSKADQASRREFLLRAGFSLRPSQAFSLVEILVSAGIIVILAALTLLSARRIFEDSSLAISAANIRQLSAGGAAYLGDHNNTYWPYRNTDADKNVIWWYGFETKSSMSSAEGTRDFDPDRGPLGGYIPKSMRPDPSFSMGSRGFKPKYRSGYIGTGYNAEIGGGYLEQYKSTNQNTAETYKLRNQGTLLDGSQVVVFATAAQVNTFQPPASAAKPMVEEFYAIDRQYKSVHFRHHGKAMVSFANGSVGFLPIDESTRDGTYSNANIGRFAPVGSTRYLLPATNQ